MKINDRKGASAIEFAIILPVLVVLLFGIVEFSILLYDKAMITNASREGARAGIIYDVPRPNDAEIKEVVKVYCGTHLINLGSAASLEDDDITITITRTGSSSGDTLQVKVEYQYDFLVIPNFIGNLAGGINLGAETTMRME